MICTCTNNNNNNNHKREKSFDINLISFFLLSFFCLDNMIRIYDSTTVRYKCQNEIIARDMNWCILDIAFSPGSEYFIYSTWSSCCKCWNDALRYPQKKKTMMKFETNLKFSLFSALSNSASESNKWNVTAIETVILAAVKVKLLYIFIGLFELRWSNHWRW